MNPLAQITTRLRSYWAPETAVRAEVWALGGRHNGRVLEGARLELDAPGVPDGRAVLLRAVIRSQARRTS